MTHDTAKLILPLPPSLNHAYITRRGSGQRIMTQECRSYKERVYLLVKQKIKKPLEHIDLLQYNFFWPDNRKRDADNAKKILTDALKGALLVDDSWQNITEECMISKLDRLNPRVEIVWVYLNKSSSTIDSVSYSSNGADRGLALSFFPGSTPLKERRGERL